ncbi:hypothetical protein [Bosea sp. LC85]|uniref:hypothetical protein n=1 Tax=Bosea sp. LC85 TaxID=1502851 RepID=UPI0005B945A6|nr:hypothetical protein [Bosea sp. LC85]
MEKPSREMICAIAAVLTVVAVGHLWFAAANACTAGSNVWTEVQKANGCAEFWFNRYQSFAAALLATIVAAATLLGLRAQINIARRQAALGAINELDLRLNQIREAADFCDDLKARTQEVERRVSFGIDRRGLNQGGRLHGPNMSQLVQPIQPHLKILADLCKGNESYGLPQVSDQVRDFANSIMNAAMSFSQHVESRENPEDHHAAYRNYATLSDPFVGHLGAIKRRLESIEVNLRQQLAAQQRLLLS